MEAGAASESSKDLDLNSIVKALWTVLAEGLKKTDDQDPSEALIKAIGEFLAAVQGAACATQLTVETWKVTAPVKPYDPPPNRCKTVTLVADNQSCDSHTDPTWSRCLKFVAADSGIVLWRDVGGVETAKPLTVFYRLKADPNEVQASLRLLRSSLSESLDLSGWRDVDSVVCSQLDLAYLLSLFATAFVRLRTGDFESCVDHICRSIEAVARAAAIADNDPAGVERSVCVTLGCNADSKTGPKVWVIDGQLDVPDEFGTAPGSTFVHQKMQLRLGSDSMTTLQSVVNNWLTESGNLVDDDDPTKLDTNVLKDLWEGLVGEQVGDIRDGLKNVSKWLNRGMRASDKGEPGPLLYVSPQWNEQEPSVPAAVYALVNLNAHTRARFAVKISNPNDTARSASKTLNSAKRLAQE